MNKSVLLMAVGVFGLAALVVNAYTTTTVKSYQPPQMVAEVNTALAQQDARVQAGMFTNSAGGSYTQTFTTVYSAAPIVTATYAENPVATNVIYTTRTPSNCIFTGTASKMICWVAVAQ